MAQVLEQASLYRLSSIIKLDRFPSNDNSPTTDWSRSIPRERVRSFSESLVDIEKLRLNQIQRLNELVQVDKLPEHVNLGDPDLLPFLNSTVRAIVEAFPRQAEEIVKEHGLHSHEFNKMLEETKSNPYFRWMVQKQIRSISPLKNSQI